MGADLMPIGTPLPQRASVVIVGGGIMGVSAAFHLAEAGVHGVVLLERDQLGSGSTSRAAGGVRAQFSDALNTEIARRSLAAFADFAHRPGWEIDFKQVGYLFVLSREEDCAAFEANVELQHELGVPSRMLTTREVHELCPLVATDDVRAGAFSPTDGHATPEAAVQGYASAARQLGAHIETDCEALDVTLKAGQIAEVITTKGAIATDSVICAAGPWSRAVAALFGVDLPVTPVRRQVLFTQPLPDLPASLPMTIDFASSFYFHREGPGLLMGMSHESDPVTFNLDSSDDWVPALLEVAERRAPKIASIGIKGGWAGLYEMSPDRNAMIGESSAVPGFFYATGFSGHGFLQGPAVGEILRDLYLKRPPFVDVSPLSAERFAVGELRPEFNVI
jgi:sarcosine oxidase subunit beta